MKLSLENGREESISDPADLAPFLRRIDRDGNNFAILASADEHYVQAAMIEGGFIIEKRLGNAASHFEATRTAPSMPVAAPARPWWKFWGNDGVKADRFTLDDVIRTFAAFMGDGSEPVGLHWKPANWRWMSGK